MQFKIILGLIILFIFGLFLSVNSDAVNVDLIVGEPHKISLALVVLISFISGAFIATLMNLITNVSSKKKQKHQQEESLDDEDIE